MAIIRLLEQLISVEDKTLFLLDEAELALHPRIQKNLLSYIQKKAEEKDLTVFIATHSITMIKACAPKHIMLLREHENKIGVVTPCYPAEAIGSVDFEANTICDTVIFVEDDMAKLLLKSMITIFMVSKPDKAGNMYDIVPVGGYEQTALLAKNVKERILKQSRVVAILDKDAETEELNEKCGNEKFKELYRSQGLDNHYIFFLPYTPEVWFISCLERADNKLKNIIKDKYRCEVTEVVQSQEYKNCLSTKERKLAKQKFDVFIKLFTARTGEDINVVTKDVIELLVEQCMERNVLMTTVAKVFR